MKLLIIISEYSLKKKLLSIAQKLRLDFNFSVMARGTADSQLLDFLGLGDNEKMIVFAPITDDKIQTSYQLLENELRFSRAGTGIAFTLPVNKVSAAITRAFFKNENIQPQKLKENMLDYSHQLIITVTNRGLFKAVKDAASKEGARGGTVIHGLGTGGREAAKFLGITLSEEKDVVFIIVPSVDCEKVMKRITKEAGLSTETHGICFAVPVTSAHGLAEKINGFLNIETTENI